MDHRSRTLLLGGCGAGLRARIVCVCVCVFRRSVCQPETYQFTLSRIHEQTAASSFDVV